MTAVPFSYDEMVGRNIGFVTEAEQRRLKGAHVVVCGVGGMGGAAVACLVRTGIGHFTIADIDTFELSNLNRQMFANLDTVGLSKAATTKDAILRINPECSVEVLGAEWTERLDTLVNADVIINGCDDVKATLALLRAAAGRVPVIDAFAATLPSVYVIKPDDPRPEELFGYPSRGRAIASLSADDVSACVTKELAWVMAHSSTRKHVVMEVAMEFAAGKRKRFSFAPMVWMTGCLMAYEAIRLILGKPGGPGVGGAFVNPWELQVEQPPPAPLAKAKQWAMEKALAVMQRMNK